MKFSHALEITGPDRFPFDDGFGDAEAADDALFSHAAVNIARRLGTPIALVSLAGADRQWVRARAGIAAGRIASGCAFGVETRRGPATVAVADAREDPRFCGDPLVAGPTGLRGFLSAPLVSPEGTWLGAVCALELRPRRFTQSERAYLEGVARKLVVQRELRRLRGEVDAAGVMDELLGRMKAAEQRGDLRWGYTLVELIYAASDAFLRDEG